MALGYVGVTWKIDGNNPPATITKHACGDLAALGPIGYTAAKGYILNSTCPTGQACEAIFHAEYMGAKSTMWIPGHCQ